jgi:hypothetical protein
MRNQWLSSRVFTPLTGWHCKLRPNTEGTTAALNLCRGIAAGLGFLFGARLCIRLFLHLPSLEEALFLSHELLWLEASVRAIHWCISPASLSHMFGSFDDVSMLQA